MIKRTHPKLSVGAQCRLPSVSRSSFYYEPHGEMGMNLADFLAAYHFDRRLKTLNGLTPYEYICKICTSEPERSILNSIHQMQGLNT